MLLESENQTSDKKKGKEKVKQIQPREKNAKNMSLIARKSEVR